MTVREEQGNLKQTVYITSDRKRFPDCSAQINLAGSRKRTG